jgi:replicative DNA helicase
MECREKSENAVLNLGVITRSLLGLAKQLRCPVIALSQLSRAPQGREGHRPVLSDLRQSGAIEQDANQVIFVYREDHALHEKSTKPGIAELIVAKNRSGQTGTAEVRFAREYTAFDDLSQQPERTRPSLGDGGGDQ